MQSKFKIYAKNLTSYFGASLIPMVLSLVSNPWIAKNMSPTDYAISGYYTSFSSLISPIIIFYFIHYYIKEYFRRDDLGRQQLYAIIAKATIWFSGLVSLICFAGLFVYLTFINKTLSFPVMPYLALMVFALPLTGLLNLQLAQYRMQKKANAYFLLSAGNGILNVLLTVLLVVWIKWGAFGKLLGPLICNSSVFLFLLWKMKWVFKIKTPISDFKQIFIFCLPLAASATLGYFTNGFTTTYLESIGNNIEYGYYVVGASMAASLTTFTTAIGNTFQPNLYETTINKQWKKYSMICGLEVGCFIIIAVCFIICAPFIISILTAGRYVSSAPYSQIIALSTITSGIYFLINQFTIATNRPRLYLYTSILGSIFIVCMTPVFVKKWNYFGGAWMTAISYIAFSIINLILLSITKAKAK